MIIEDLLEAFESPYLYAKSVSSPNAERYIVETRVGVYMVDIRKGESGVPEVSFSDHSRLSDINNSFANKGLSPIRLFSTIIDIIRKSSVVRYSGSFFFTATGGEASRIRLYERLLKVNGVRYERENLDGKVAFRVIL